MIKHSNDPVIGVIVDETVVYNLEEASYTCGVSIAVIQEMMEYGLVEPKKISAQECQLDPQAVHYLKIAIRLQKDLGVNLPGAALALDMLRELHELRARLKILEQKKEIE